MTPSPIKRLLLPLVFFSAALPFFCAGTFSVGLKYFGLSVHPKGAVNASLMPLKLDKNGIFVFNLGASANAEYFIWHDIVSVKAVQAFYSDCIGQFAGFSHIGFRARIFKIGSFSLNGGIGPTFIYRKNWYKVPGYDDAFSFFYGEKDDEWQHRFLWYGGEFEFNYLIARSTELSFSVIPGGFDLINFSFGVRYNIPKKRRHPDKNVSRETF